MNPAPVALFVYRRPAHVEAAVHALLRNAQAQDTHLVIFSDGPRDARTEQDVARVRRFVRAVSGFRCVEVVERDINLGLARSVIDGVGRLCSEYGRAIVLEDDLVVSPHFLSYMNAALVRYADEPRVMQISGHMFPVEIRVDAEAFFLPFVTSWGWSTWDRAWRMFDPDASGHERLRTDARLKHRFDLLGSYPYYAMLEAQLAGKIDSWAVRWYLSVFLNAGLVLYPARTMVKNAGLDGSGEHRSTGGCSDVLDEDFQVEHFPPVAADAEGEAKVYAYLRSQRSTMTRVRRKLREVMTCAARRAKY